MYCTYFQSISLEGSRGFSSHLRLGFSLWEVKDRWHSVWLQVNYFVSTFFGHRWCIENWSSVKCLAHNLEVFVATNPSRRRLCTQIRLNFGSFGKRYIATPFCDRMLQLNAAHWGIFKEMQQNFAIYYRYAQYLFTLSGSFWRHTQREISRVYRKSFLGSSTFDHLQRFNLSLFFYWIINFLFIIPLLTHFRIKQIFIKNRFI